MSDFKNWEASVEQATPAQWPAVVPPVAPTPEPTVEENANMIRQAGEWLAKKAVEASGLAERVKHLEGLVEELQMDLRNARVDLSAEQVAHASTRSRLDAVESELARKESVVHDLVMERDIALSERNVAQDERNAARRESDNWQELANANDRKWLNAQHENSVLRERCETLTQRIAAFRQAYAELGAAA